MKFGEKKPVSSPQVLFPCDIGQYPPKDGSRFAGPKEYWNTWWTYRSSAFEGDRQSDLSGSLYGTSKNQLLAPTHRTGMYLTRAGGMRGVTGREYGTGRLRDPSRSIHYPERRKRALLNGVANRAMDGKR